MDEMHDNLPEAEGRKDEDTTQGDNAPENNEDQKAETPADTEANESTPDTTEEVKAEEDTNETEVNEPSETTVEAQADPEPEKSSEATEEAETPSEEVSTEPEVVAEEASEDSAEPEAARAKAEESSQPDEDPIHVSDEEMEKEDDTEEVESDEDEHDHLVNEELELPDYAEYEPEKLIEAAQKIFREHPIQRIREHFESIRRNLLKQLNEERQHKLEEFIESGGNEIDFEYIQPLRERFRKVYSEYRTQRKKYYDSLREQLDNNLRIKTALIEQLKEIVTKDESISDTFKEFNQLQQEWRNTGPVPRAESSDLWRTYHFHVENFYEYIKINKELRDLDFKKNREKKEELLARAVALKDETDLKKTFATLQELHKQWKNTGPVERENREPLWQKFSEATKDIHVKREEYVEGLRERRDELIEEKRKIVERLRQLDISGIDTHSGWQKAIRTIESMREEFRKIGRINHPENDKIWDEFRGELRSFNRSKNTFYKELKKEHLENLAKKKELLAIAENLKESDDWQVATNEMKRIQAQWKRIGHVPKSESDKIWKQFRAACNHYFNRLTEHNKSLDKGLEKNLEAKKAALAKLNDFEPLKDQKESIKALMAMVTEWKSLGRVPKDERKIDADFNKLLDAKFKAIDLDKKEAQRIRFENRMSNLKEGGDDRALRRERDQVKRKMDEASKELNQLENNIAFFSSSNPKNPFIKEVERKIRQQQDAIEGHKEKIKMLNIEIRKINKVETAEEENNESESSD